MKPSKTLAELSLERRNREMEKSFLPSWTPRQFEYMERKISAHFSYKPMQTLHGNYPEMYLGWQAVSERLGLAYTSSSSYAGYWVCNTEVYNSKFPGYHYTGFALSSNGKGYAILWDKDENEIIINL